jgi:hypothetical protein
MVCKDSGRECAWSIANNVCNRDGRLWHKTGNNGRCIHEKTSEGKAITKGSKRK